MVRVSLVLLVLKFPQFDDLQVVTEFADNMKNKISEGWASITSTVGGWWDKAKSAIGLGDDVADQGAMQSEKKSKRQKIELRSKSRVRKCLWCIYNKFGRESVGIENDEKKIAELNKKMQLSLGDSLVQKMVVKWIPVVFLWMHIH